MNGSLLIWAALAVTTCWSVGVYNRLMRMRARAVSALGSVEKYMKQFSELAHTHLVADGAPQQATDGDPVAELAEHLPTDGTQLLVCLAKLDSALKAVREDPLAKQPLIHLGVAFDTLEQAWRRLCDSPADHSGARVSEDLRSQWEISTRKVQTARGGLNQILCKYNEAIEQFPARLVAGVARFEPAGHL